MSTSILEKQTDFNPQLSPDFENCKGQCGYTIWCKACLEERKQTSHADLSKEDNDNHGK